MSKKGLEKFFGLESKRVGLWTEFFKLEFMDRGFTDLLSDVAHHYAIEDLRMTPREAGHVFRSFRAPQLHRAKVIILGQDPYPNQKQAEGWAFSSADEVGPLPPSLDNICKEIKEEGLIQHKPVHGNLGKWVEQGVMLLNMCLTSEEGNAGIHRGQEGRTRLATSDKLTEAHGYGWEHFTLKALRYALAYNPNLIMVAWGKDAKGVCELLKPKHLLTSPHPSPLSAHKGYFGNGHFLKINEILTELGKSVIDWRL